MIDPIIFGENVSFDGLENTAFFIGMINEFNNRFQAAADVLLQELSWKQSFLLKCISFFKEPPSINQLAELTGSSHQNIKQLLNRLEKGGYVKVVQDEEDRRKQRVTLTEKTCQFRREHERKNEEKLSRLFEGVTEQELAAATETITKLHINIKAMMEESK